MSLFIGNNLEQSVSNYHYGFNNPPLRLPDRGNLFSFGSSYSDFRPFSLNPNFFKSGYNNLFNINFSGISSIFQNLISYKPRFNFTNYFSSMRTSFNNVSGNAGEFFRNIGNKATAFGSKLARAAYKIASGMNVSGWCARGVRKTLESLGIRGIGAQHAYQLAPQLANNRNFQEIRVSAGDLKNLPPGNVVIYGPSSRNRSGHAFITLGRGMEANSEINKSIYKPWSWFRVFVPKSDA